jgi:hypothetical protein
MGSAAEAASEADHRAAEASHLTLAEVSVHVGVVDSILSSTAVAAGAGVSEAAVVVALHLSRVEGF